MNLTEQLPFRATLEMVGTIADKLGIETYAVGGIVRDILLERVSNDIDFVTIGKGSGIALAQAVAKTFEAGLAHVHKNFGTAGVHINTPEGKKLVLEFVGARKESYDRNSRKPVVENGTLSDDQNRRDFTVNAMAIALNYKNFGTVIDPFNGKDDLSNRILKTPLAPETTFSDDPLRMMRAARFATQLNFTIQPETYDAMKRMASRMDIVSQERITEEIQKIMLAPKPSLGFKILFHTGILARIFPLLTALAGVEEIGGQRHKDNFFHTLQVVDNVVELSQPQPAEETLWLRWAALLHDIGKPSTKRFTSGQGWTFHGHEDRGGRMIPRIFKTLRLPIDERMRYVQKLVKLHHRPVALVDNEVTDSAVRRLLFEAGDDIDDLMLLVRADITSKNPNRVKRYLGHFDLVEEKMVVVEEKDQLRNFQPPVDGHEIMETLNLAPGRAVGDIKKAIEEAILEGQIPNEHEAAFSYMMNIKDQILANYPEFTNQ